MPSDVAVAEVPLPFNLDDIRTQGWFSRLVERALDRPQWLMAPLRRFFPIARLPYFGVTAVARYDDVQEVLSHDRIFDVPWKQQVRDLNEGRTFLLGMDIDQEHRRLQRDLMKVFRHDDVASIVTPRSAAFSEAIVENALQAGGRLEAIEGLITLVPTRICEEYFGIAVTDSDSFEERRAFAHWMLAMSTFTFGNPRDNPRFRAAGTAAAQRVRALVDRRIAEAKARPDPGDSVLGRLVTLQRENPAVDDVTIRTWLIGMMTGFVPTNTMAAGRALEVLLREPSFLAECQKAAQAGDDERLWRCLRETMRFMPIFLGAQRICRQDYVLAEGTPRATMIKAGQLVVASTWSAMFDATRIVEPHAFNPDRPASSYMLFGFGPHACLGVLIAQAQILQTMKALLRRPGLRRAPGKDGRLEWLGQFPGKLVVQIDRV